MGMASSISERWQRHGTASAHITAIRSWLINWINRSMASLNSAVCIPRFSLSLHLSARSKTPQVTRHAKVLPECDRFQWQTAVFPGLFSRRTPRRAHREHQWQACLSPIERTAHSNFRRIINALRIQQAQSLRLPHVLHIPRPR